MSLINEIIEFVKSIISNVKISWIGMAIIILLLIIFLIVKWILGKYKKGKSTIKENFKEFWNDLRNLKGWQKVIFGVGGEYSVYLYLEFVTRLKSLIHIRKLQY